METVFSIGVCCNCSVWGSGCICGWLVGTGFALCEGRCLCIVRRLSRSSNGRS